MHFFVPIVIPDSFPKVIYPLKDFYFTLSPFIAIASALGLSYLYAKAVKLENPFRKAILATLMGTFIFWASCIGLLCALAPALRNM